MHVNLAVRAMVLKALVNVKVCREGMEAECI